MIVILVSNSKRRSPELDRVHSTAAQRATKAECMVETPSYQARSTTLRLALLQQRQCGRLPEGVGQYSKRIDYFYDVLQSSFHDRRRNISHTRPHLLVGNKVRSLHEWGLICDLLGFDLHDGRLEQRNCLKSTP
ncbi:hypothetical protein FALCPG4_015914 [Fusarium falciforme]